jgi:mercuric ion transport protein
MRPRTASSPIFLATTPHADGDACARPLPDRLVKTGLILASLLAVAALGFNFLAPLFLNS